MGIFSGDGDDSECGENFALVYSLMMVIEERMAM